MHDVDGATTKLAGDRMLTGRVEREGAKLLGGVQCLMQAALTSRSNGQTQPPPEGAAKLEIRERRDGHVGKLMQPTTVARAPRPAKPNAVTERQGAEKTMQTALVQSSKEETLGPSDVLGMGQIKARAKGSW